MINSSNFISKVAPILEEQYIFIKKIIFETFEDSKEIKIIIEGHEEMIKCPYNLDGYCYAFNKKCSEIEKCNSKILDTELNEKEKTNAKSRD